MAMFTIDTTGIMAMHDIMSTVPIITYIMAIVYIIDIKIDPEIKN